MKYYLLWIKSGRLWPKSKSHEQTEDDSYISRIIRNYGTSVSSVQCPLLRGLWFAFLTFYIGTFKLYTYWDSLICEKQQQIDVCMSYKSPLSCRPEITWHWSLTVKLYRLGPIMYFQSTKKTSGSFKSQHDSTSHVNTGGVSNQRETDTDRFSFYSCKQT